MKETRYKPTTSVPFGLHDCHINEIDMIDDNLILTIKESFYDTNGTNVSGNIIIEAIDLDYCAVMIQGNVNKMGDFQGEKLTLSKFKDKYKEFSFEIIDEYYGNQKLQLTGWL